MKINKINFKKYKYNTIIYSEIEYKNNSKILWYKVDNKYINYIHDSSDSFLIGLLIPAMKYGEDIYIDGKISEKLFYNMSYKLQVILKQIIPSLNIIKIIPDNLNNKYINPKGIATGFSGGIDSFSVLNDYYFNNNISSDYKINHIIFNNVGSHGRKGDKLFDIRYNNLKNNIESLNLPFIKINSNLDLFYNYKDLNFQRTHTIRNVSAIMLLQNHINKYYYASTYNYKNIYIGNTYDMAYSDMVILPLLSTENLKTISVGGEYSRVEKTLQVANIKEAYDILDVCVDPDITRDINCSKCFKCMRTILTLEIIGRMDNFSKIFNYDEYFKNRDYFIASCLISKDPLIKEILDYAKSKNYKFPKKSYLIKYFLSLYRFIKKIIR